MIRLCATMACRRLVQQHRLKCERLIESKCRPLFARLPTWLGSGGTAAKCHMQTYAISRWVVVVAFAFPQ
jgi:hypothetical protein